jgi:hypothetical protein
MPPCAGTCADSLAFIQRLRHRRKCPILAPVPSLRRALCLPGPGTLGEFRDESLYMGIDIIMGLCQMVTWRRHIVPVLHAGVRWGEVTDIAAQRDDAKSCPQFFPGDVPGSMVRDVQPLPAQQCHHARRCRGVWLRARRGDLHLEATLCRQVLTIRCREDTFCGIVRTQKHNSATHRPFSPAWVGFSPPAISLSSAFETSGAGHVC